MMMLLLNKPFFLSHQQSAHGNRLTTNEAKDVMRSWFDKKKSSRSLFFLSFTSLRWERKSFMFALDLVDQKKESRKCTNDVYEHIRRIGTTESFSTESWAGWRRDPNHDGDTKRPEFYERICRFPSLFPHFIQLFGACWGSSRGIFGSGKKSFRLPLPSRRCTNVS